MAGSAADISHLRHEVMVAGISNACFNGFFAWLLMKDGPALRWDGEHSFVVDIIATGLLLPLIVALIVIPLQRSKLRKGRLAPIDLGNTSLIQALANRFPAATFRSAMLFGLIGLVVAAPLTLFVFQLVGVQQASVVNYAIFKGLWTGLLAAVLVIPMVLIALRKPGITS
ncbi:MAG: hypothetical protein R3E50_04200 [Halioglobus sp.]